MLLEVRNILMSMVLAGLWHGAAWTFVIWGLLHGIGISSVHIIRRFGGGAFTQAIPAWLALLLTFHVVTFSWVFFSALSLNRASTLLSAPFNGGGWDALLNLASENAYALFLMVVFSP